MELINCLSYALNFWAAHPKYVIVYNEDHAINIPDGAYVLNSSPSFVPLETYGYSFLVRSFGKLLTEHDKCLLDVYLEKRKNKIV